MPGAGTSGYQDKGGVAYDVTIGGNAETKLDSILKKIAEVDARMAKMGTAGGSKGAGASLSANIAKADAEAAKLKDTLTETGKVSERSNAIKKEQARLLNRIAVLEERSLDSLRRAEKAAKRIEGLNSHIAKLKDKVALADSRAALAAKQVLDKEEQRLVNAEKVRQARDRGIRQEQEILKATGLTRKQLYAAVPAYERLAEAQAKRLAREKGITREAAKQAQEAAKQQAWRQGGSAITQEQARAEATKRMLKYQNDLAIKQAQIAQLSDRFGVSQRRAAEMAGVTSAQAKQLGLSMWDAEHAARQFLFTFRRLVGILAVFTLARKVAQQIGAAVREMVDFNEQLEAAENTLATIYSSVAQVTDEQGNLLEGAEAFAAALELSKKTIKELRFEALGSVATFKALLTAYQAGVGPGLSSGLDLDTIRKVTKTLAEAAIRMQLPVGQLNEEIRSIIQGTARARDTRLAQLFGGAAEINRIVREAREAGNLAEVLLEKTEALRTASASTADSYAVMKSNLSDAVSLILGEAGESLFSELKTTFGQLGETLRREIEGVDGGKITVLSPEALELASALGDALAEIVRIVREEFAANEGMALFTEAFRTLQDIIAVTLPLVLDLLAGITEGLRFALAPMRIFAALMRSLEDSGLGEIADLLGTILTATVALGVATKAWAVQKAAVLGLAKLINVQKLTELSLDRKKNLVQARALWITTQRLLFQAKRLLLSKKLLVWDLRLLAAKAKKLVLEKLSLAVMGKALVVMGLMLAKVAAIVAVFLAIEYIMDKIAEKQRKASEELETSEESLRKSEETASLIAGHMSSMEEESKKATEQIEKLEAELRKMSRTAGTTGLVRKVIGGLADAAEASRMAVKQQQDKLKNLRTTLRRAEEEYADIQERIAEKLRTRRGGSIVVDQEARRKALTNVAKAQKALQRAQEDYVKAEEDRLQVATLIAKKEIEGARWSKTKLKLEQARLDVKRAEATEDSEGVALAKWKVAWWELRKAQEDYRANQKRISEEQRVLGVQIEELERKGSDRTEAEDATLESLKKQKKQLEEVLKVQAAQNDQLKISGAILNKNNTIMEYHLANVKGGLQAVKSLVSKSEDQLRSIEKAAQKAKIEAVRLNTELTKEEKAAKVAELTVSLEEDTISEGLAKAKGEYEALSAAVQGTRNAIKDLGVQEDQEAKDRAKSLEKDLVILEKLRKAALDYLNTLAARDTAKTRSLQAEAFDADLRERLSRLKTFKAKEAELDITVARRRSDLLAQEASERLAVEASQAVGDKRRSLEQQARVKLSEMALKALTIEGKQRVEILRRQIDESKHALQGVDRLVRERDEAGLPVAEKTRELLKTLGDDLKKQTAEMALLLVDNTLKQADAARKLEAEMQALNEQNIRAFGSIGDNMALQFRMIREEMGSFNREFASIMVGGVRDLASTTSSLITGLIDPREDVDPAEMFGEYFLNLAGQIFDMMLERLFMELFSNLFTGLFDDGATIANTAALTILTAAVNANTASQQAGALTAGFSPFGFAEGGAIPRPSNIAASDTVPAWLTPGEFVLRKEAVKSLGLAALNKLNGSYNTPSAAKALDYLRDRSRVVRGYADGGPVQASGAPRTVQSGGQSVTVLPAVPANDRTMKQLLSGGKDAFHQGVNKVDYTGDPNKSGQW